MRNGQQSYLPHEKKFNLDAPDGLRYYHDLRKEQQLLSRRSVEGGDIVVWGDINYYGKMKIKFIAGEFYSRTFKYANFSRFVRVVSFQPNRVCVVRQLRCAFMVAQMEKRRLPRSTLIDSYTMCQLLLLFHSHTAILITPSGSTR